MSPTVQRAVNAAPRAKPLTEFGEYRGKEWRHWKDGEAPGRTTVAEP